MDRLNITVHQSQARRGARAGMRETRLRPQPVRDVAGHGSAPKDARNAFAPAARDRAPPAGSLEASRPGLPPTDQKRESPGRRTASISR